MGLSALKGYAIECKYLIDASETFCHDSLQKINEHNLNE